MTVRPLCLALFLLLSVHAHADDAFIHRIIVDAFPTMTARIVAIDDRTGTQRSLDGADITVYEDGNLVASSTVQCPPYSEPVPLSSVLAIDVSGSMASGAPNMRLAQEAARAWIDALPGGSDCAITSFDDKHYINADFTSDKKRLRTVLDKLKPKGGTNFAAGFLGEPYGALRVAATGSHRRVLVFLTDGQGFGRAIPVIEQALRDSITVYCVSLGLAMPAMLRDVAEATGGLWFENVTTVDEAVAAYRRILTIASGAGACSVQWTSVPSCVSERKVTIIVRGDTIRSHYTVPAPYRVTMTAAPSSIDFNLLRMSPSTTQEVELKATGRDIVITRVEQSATSPFAVESPDVPFTVKAGEVMKIRVRYTPQDSLYAYGRMTLRTDACGDVHLDAMAGSRDLNPERPTLHVVSPNGGETIPGGFRAKLRYDGVPPNVPIRLDVSTDNGRTWLFVTSFAKNHMVEWRAPVIDSDSCLLRATHERNAIPETRLTPRATLNGVMMQDIAISPTGDLVATMGRISRADTTPVTRIYDTRTGALIRSVQGGGTGVTWVDSSSIIAWGRTEVTRFSSGTGERSWTIPLRGNSSPHLVHVTPDRTTIVGGVGDPIQIVSTESGAQERTLPRSGIDVKWARISPDGAWLALGELDSSLTVHSLRQRSAPTTIALPASRGFLNAVFTSDGERLAVTTRSGRALLLDRATGSIIRDYPVRAYINDNGYLAISPDDRQIVMETGRDSTSILDLATGAKLITLQRALEPSGPYEARYTPDGTRILLTTIMGVTIFEAGSGARVNRYHRMAGAPSLSLDGRLIATVNSEDFAGVYDLFGSPLQQDVSDAHWRIVKAGAVLKDIGFATQFANTQKDSIVRDGLRNTGRYAFTVSELRLEGTQAQQFTILTTTPFTVQPGETVPIEYAFSPRGAGIRSCNIYAETDIGTLRARMSGRAIMPDLSLNVEHVDFGVVRVGTGRQLSPERLVRNVGTAPITITKLVLNGPDNTSFTIVDDKPFTLAPNESRSIPLAFHPAERGRTSSSLLISVKGALQDLEITLHGEGVDTIIRLMDPTTFRSIILPSAVIPPPGTITTGVYDVLGLQAGASVHENIMILAGGTIPFNSSWLGADDDRAAFNAAYSLGVKGGMRINDEWIAGGGYQFGQSVYDKGSTPEFESRITYNALWATAGYGDDDARINAYAGYAFKHHVTAYEGTFNADATILGLAGDYRFAENWKICGEGFFMRTMTFVPITVTARYFTTWYALEAGLTVTAIAASGAEPSGTPVIPMLTWVARW